MNTFLSSEQEALKTKFSAFVDSTVAPLSTKLENHDCCLKDVLQNLAQEGYLGLTVPREYGGQGHSLVEAALFFETLGSAEPGLALSLSAHYALIEVIKSAGSNTLKSRYLPLLARAELLGTVAYAEAAAGSDLSLIEAQITESGEKLYLNGLKRLVVNGEIAGLAAVLACMRNSDKEGGDESKLALAMVDLTESQGVKVGPNAARLGLRSAFMNDVDFSSVAVSNESLLIGTAGSDVDSSIDVAKVLLASAAVGMLESCTRLSVEYANKRAQFGKLIGQFQGIQWKLADMATEASASRLHVLRAAWSYENDHDKFPTYAAMAKGFAGRAARAYSAEAVQINGLSGLLEGSPLERFYRDAKVIEIVMGTSELQKVSLVKTLGI